MNILTNYFQSFWEKIKTNKRLFIDLILIFLLITSILFNFTKFNKKEDNKTDIVKKLDDKIALDQVTLKQIQVSLDSLHVEQRYLEDKIDGTQITIKTLEKQRNEKVKYIYTNNVDSTVKLLRDRYSKLP
jgi:ubiquinone biosynthesis protein Coq4